MRAVRAAIDAKGQLSAPLRPLAEALTLFYPDLVDERFYADYFMTARHDFALALQSSRHPAPLFNTREVVLAPEPAP